MLSLELEIVKVDFILSQNLKFRVWSRSHISVADLMAFNWDTFLESNQVGEKNLLFRQPFKE
jgi:hypothetical protein